MPYSIHNAILDDLLALESLLTAYMQETYHRPWGGTTQVSNGLYQRCARCFPGADCYVSGRAFRRLTELPGQNLRDIVKNLPEPAWNYEL